MTFKKGVSGNYSGRRKGTGHRQVIFNTLVQPHKEALFAKAIDLALDGNEAMLRLFLDRMLPAKPSDEPANFNLSDELIKTRSPLEIGEGILGAMREQSITLDQASTLFSILKAHRENILVDDFGKQIKEIKKKLELE